MKKILILLMLSLIGCQRMDEEITVAFDCDVESVEFLSDNTAEVIFSVSLDGVSKEYTVRQPYTENKGEITIGEDIVYISDFQSTSGRATFNFFYGEGLGPFCLELFDALPMHDHVDFNAEAIRSVGGKGVGKWKIVSKKNLLF